jgi:D-sedoheptulose 7-phosphate isomerase
VEAVVSAPAARRPLGLPTGAEHVAALSRALGELGSQLWRVQRWGAALADVLQGGGRLLAAGNGGSAAQAQHLTSELVGRYRDDRRPFSAIALHTETSSLTAITNDYGAHEAFARQVLAHGRPGDVLMALSTSGASLNVLAAAEAARSVGITVWGLTGMAPNPLASACDDALCVPAAATATVQEVHLVVVHLLCAEIDVVVGCSPPAPANGAGAPARPVPAPAPARRRAAAAGSARARTGARTSSPGRTRR